jgi:molybdopterin synthase catalytic subunit
MTGTRTKTRLAVRARLFAIQRELAGRREIELELPPGATVEDAWDDLVRRFPVLAPGRPYVRFARNGEYAEAQAPLADGDEVAVIPPVSGGSLSPPRSGGVAIESFRRLELTTGPLDDALVGALRNGVAHPRVGAIVTFLGVTRETPGSPAPGEEDEAARHAGEPVLGLEYEAFDELARLVLAAIADEVAEHFDVQRLAIVHRTGAVAVGEPSVAIVAGASHRAAAFSACRYAIDELKARAPIWKSERFAGGSVWIGQPARDEASGHAVEEAT